MADDKKSNHNFLRDLIQDGGLAQLFLGPLGSALLNLTAKAADIPAAWLEQKAKNIRSHLPKVLQNTELNPGNLPWPTKNSAEKLTDTVVENFIDLAARSSKEEQADSFFRILIAELQSPGLISVKNLEKLKLLDNQKAQMITAVLPLIRQTEVSSKWAEEPAIIKDKTDNDTDTQQKSRKNPLQDLSTVIKKFGAIGKPIKKLFKHHNKQ